MPDERGVDLTMRQGYLSLGSNVGEREVNVLRAVRLIAGMDGLWVGRCSSLYETAPVGGVSGGYFINTVLEVQALLSPTDLLLRLKELEEKLGRSGGSHAAREIDIDIITLGKESISLPALIIPHPRYFQRAFVLIPLREIAPDFHCPVTGRPIDEIMEGVPSAQWISRASTRDCIYA